MMRYFHFLFLIFLSSCLPEEPEEVVPEYENAQKPLNNDLILSESVFGNSTNNSLWLFVEKSDTDNFYAVGSINSSQSSTNVSVGAEELIDYYDASLIKFDKSGQEIWSRQPGFSIYRHFVIPKGLLGSKEYIVVTGYDENEANPSDPDRNRFMLFDENGDFKSNYSVDFSLRLNSMVITENNPEYLKFLVVGSVYKTAQANFYPAYCEFKIRKTNFEIFDYDPTQIIDVTWKNVLFENIEISNGKYVVSGYLNDGNPNNEKYLGAHISVHNSTNLKLFGWRNEIKNYDTGKELYHWRRGLHVYENKVYICGYYEDTNKKKTSGGNHWSSPFLSCYDLNNGNLKFTKVYPQSTKSDKFYGIGDYNGNLLVSGLTSQSYCSACSQEFTVGNGWVCKINPDSGDLLSQATFGSAAHCTWISQFCIIQNSLWGVGYKRFTNQTGLGWLIQLNPDDI